MGHVLCKCANTVHITLFQQHTFIIEPLFSYVNRVYLAIIDKLCYNSLIRLERDRDSLVVVVLSRNGKGGNANEYDGSIDTFIGYLYGIDLFR